MDTAAIYIIIEKSNVLKSSQNNLKASTMFKETKQKDIQKAINVISRIVNYISDIS